MWIDSPGPYGRTALHYAAFHGAPWEVRDLIARGANVNARGDEGMTPLHMAIYNEYPSIVAMLLDAGADPNARDNKGTRPADWIRFNEHLRGTDVARRLQRLTEPRR